MLCLLEQNTPWENQDELYVGLYKEAVYKDLKVACSPLDLWEYCAERHATILSLMARNLFQI